MMNRPAVVICFALFFINLTFGQDKDYKKFYYPDGSIASEGFLVDGKPEGYWKSYYPNGSLKSIGKRNNFLLDSIWLFYSEKGYLEKSISYLNGLKNGYYLEYDFNENISENVLISKELFLNDKKEGPAEYYYINGTLKETCHFKNNVKDGIALEYRNNIPVSENLFRDGKLVEIERINRLNAQGNKEGIWKEYYDKGIVKSEISFKNGTEDGYVRRFDENGQLSSSILYKNGKIETEKKNMEIPSDLKEIFRNGKLFSRGPFIEDSVPVGIHTYFDTNGVIIRTEIYNLKGNLISKGVIDSTGNRQGNWTNFFDNGNIKSKGFYLNNRQEGEWVFFYESGKVEQKGKFNNGRLTGIWNWYYPIGELWKTEEYLNGKLEGLYNEFDSIGNSIADGTFFDGQKDGLWTVHSGDVVEKGKYINGLREGEWKYFYSNGNLLFEGSYIQGNPDGKHILYYPDGKLREEKYFVMGYREKNWKKYNEQGELVLTVTYKDDVEYRINGEKIDLESDRKKIK